jgi:asparagine synthase (glutamine-hydrolysing)
MAGRLQTTGIIISGSGAIEQTLRLRRIIAALGAVDYRIHIADYMPDPRPDPGGREHEPPLSEFYREAFQAIWSAMANQGATELLSGIGGDELTPIYEDDTGARPLRAPPAFEILTPRARDAAQTCLPDQAPPSPIPLTSLLAHACRSPYLARTGLWPVNPLCDRDLVDFCHSLPERHRLGRRPLRRYCERVLGNDLFRPGYRKETFAAVFPDAVTHYHQVIAVQLRESVLAATGLVDLPAVHTLLEHVVATRDETACGQLAFFLALERFARQIES